MYSAANQQAENNNDVSQQVVYDDSFVNADGVSTFYAAHQGKVLLEYAGKRYSFTDHSNSVSRVLTEVDSFLEQRLEIEDKLRAKLQSALGRKGKVDKFRFIFGGDTQVNLQGNGRETLNTKVGGFDFNSSARLTYNTGWFPIRANIRLNSNDLWVKGNYNVFTGTLDKVKLDSSFKVDVQIDNSIINRLLGPAFSQAISKIASNYFTRITQEQFNNKVGIKQTKLFGLYDALPEGMYVFEGVDIGYELRQAIGEYVRNSNVNLNLDFGQVTLSIKHPRLSSPLKVTLR